MSIKILIFALAIGYLMTMAQGQLTSDTSYSPAGTVAISSALDNSVQLLCNNGYYWNNQICVPCLVIPHGTCTCSGYAGCDKITCDSTYYLISYPNDTGNKRFNACQSLPTGCASLGWDSTQSIVCTSCSAGYLMVGQICVTANNCFAVNQITGICDTCSDGYYFTPNLQSNLQALTYYTTINQNVCQACLANCRICTSGNTCTFCKVGYFWTATTSTALLTIGSNTNAGYCQACTVNVPNCAQCSNATTCDKCSLGFYYQAPADANSKGQCLACGGTGTIQNCLQCSSTTTCDVCQTGYYYTVSNNANVCSQCSSAITNCTACNIPTGATAVVCTTCQSLTVYDSQSNKCIACGNTCATCVAITTTNPSTTQCATCNANFILQTTDYTCAAYASQCKTGCFTCALLSDGSTQTCSKCQDGYFSVATTANNVTYYSCSACSATTGFLRCTSLTNATQCKDGYFLLSNTCVIATTSNKTSTQNANLTSCLTISFIGSTTNTYQCASCLPSSYTNSPAGTCIYCPQCTDKTQCTIQNDQSLSCATTGTPKLACLGGYNPTTTGCAACTSGTDCSSCTAGNYLSATNTCGAAANCLTSTVVNSCTCKPTYYWSTANKACQSCTATNCDTCDATTPANCTACSAGYVLFNNVCYLTKCADQQYYTFGVGCTVCAYGYYQVTINSMKYCLQCIQPYAPFVCRQNPAISTSTTTTGTTTAPTIVTGTITSQMSTAANYYCAPGYYWNTQGCSPCQQNILNGYCQCSSYLQCTTIVCNTGYSLIQNACVAIPVGCTTIALSSDGTTINCTACSTGYSLLSNICIPSNSCASYSSSTGNCTQCQAGYYLNWQYNTYVSTTIATSTNYYFTSFPSTCTPCTISNCQLCTGPTTCTTCSTGYYWQPAIYSQSVNNQGSCQPCMQGCTSCTNNLSCSTCATGYFMVLPYSGMNFCQLCSGTITSCLTCDYTAAASQATLLLTPTCRSCSTGYYLVGNACVSCPLGCTTCSAPNVCTACATGYAQKQNTTTCTQCPSGCTTCNYNASNQLQCNACQDLYYLNRSVTPQICTICPSASNFLRCSSATVATQCQANYYLTSGNQCVVKPNGSNCLTFNDSGNCTSCLSGFIIVDNTCQSCIAKTDVNCTKCQVQSSSTGGSSTLQCIECATGYYVTSANLCASCNITGCLVCSASGCSQCQAGYYQSQVSTTSSSSSSSSSTSSSSSSTSTSSNAITCAKCVNNCSQCAQANSCTQCNTGYFLLTNTSGSTTTSSCVACQPECYSCVQPGNICQSCYTGYVLVNGGCVTLAQANCFSYGTNGCAICNYGYYLVNGVCFECLNPQSDFVCTNPVDNLYSTAQANVSSS